MSTHTHSDSIPKLNLDDFLHGSAEMKAKFVSDLGQAYEDIGFVAIRNHGVDNNTITKLYSEVAKFFELPESAKLQYDDTKGGGQRGYTGFGKEHARDRKAPDLKEFWHFGQYPDANDPLFHFYPANKTVAELRDFNACGKAIYQALETCGAAVLQAIALYLGLDEHYFDQKIHNGNSILRAIHYPPITEEPADAIRAGEHEDINLITLLVGASADGLEVLHRSGKWVPVTEVQDHIVVNVGDMLQRLSNDRLKSTTHRVVNPPRWLWNTSRYSIPFFLHPRPETRLDCLESCISADNPIRYEPISAMEFLTERLREIGLIK